ncbi:MAG: phosphoribosylanthranilate isomerase [Gemmatimonadetes bacterium]|nr:MAG: phosphoribosylanthranilate isomerase [Gemmatimonadota bacterium]
MKPVICPRVKICCITSIEEAQLAIEAGAAALGLVSEMPSGPGVISEDLIAEIAATVPPPIATFLLTCKTSAAEIIAQQRRCRVNTVQLVDRVQEGTYPQLRKSLPGIHIVQVIHVVDETSVSEAVEIAPQVDALLLDSGNPNLPVKVLGGTGKTHNWDLSHRIRERVNVPVFLAGGLKPENVPDAIRQVGAFGVDVCSGLRTAGKLDPSKVERFFTAIRRTHSRILAA